jgi:ABC-type phosphate/phosphonate transport system substrate-binding protein
MTRSRITVAGALMLFLLTLAPSIFAAPKPIVFSAPPRGTLKKETAVYQPIAEYLSRALGRPVVYQYPDNWLNYQKQMQQGHYDIIFDGPHFIGWRMARIGHQPLVKLPGLLKFVVFTRANNKTIHSLDQLAGRPVCGLAPPNLATLSMYDQYPNPVRQPLVIGVKSFPEDYARVMDGGCMAGVMRDKMFFKLQKKHGKAGRVVWTSRGLTNQGFSASKRIPAAVRKKIADALLAPEAKVPLEAFFNRFSKKNKRLIPAQTQDYAGLGSYLRDVYGFTQ